MSTSCITRLTPFLIFLSLLLAFSSGFFLHSHLTEQSYPLVEEAHSILKKHSLYEIAPQINLEHGMIKGMLQTFEDPFTTFIEPIQTELTSDNLRGHYGGIGVDLGRDGNGNWVLYPFPGKPAAVAGIQEADRLLEVDGIEIFPETTLDTIQAAIRGPLNETVMIKVLRIPELSPLEFTIIREEIQLPSLTWHAAAADPQVGVIKVNLIAASTPDEMLDAVSDLKLRGVSHFILDLRNNGGGMLEAGIDTASLFLNQGVIMQQEYKQQEIETFRVNQPGPLVDIPLVVLVNRATASAAEIIAGALKAHERAYLIGEPTYGKTTIQLIFSLSDGSSMHLTSGRWWIPDLFPPLEQTGVQPDMNFESDHQSPEAMIEAAILYLLKSG
ncbi:MAG: hypothetical protein IBX69_05100 [Anaerolineales bacterium]|nr:hypothetical protein [Anaerolineales bacterium]